MSTISKRGRKPSTPVRGRKSKTFDQLRRLYAQQEPLLKEKAKTINGKTEEFIWCIDRRSYEGRYYFPLYVVSNFGRIWSLEKNDFLEITINGEDDYRQVSLAAAGDAHIINPSMTAYVHRLIAHYFCDPDYRQRNLLLKVDGVSSEKDLEVHHMSLFCDANGNDYIDRSENLQFIDKQSHDELHEIVKAFRLKAPDPNPEDQSEEKLEALAKETLELQKKRLDELKVGFDSLMEMQVRAYALRTNPENRLSYEYREDDEGKIHSVLTVSQTFRRTDSQQEP